MSEGGTNATKRFPRYRTSFCNPAANYTVFAGSNALAVAQDQYGDLVVADASSRVQFYYPNLQAYNGGHFLPSRPFLAPGMLAAICSPGSACDPGTRTNIFGANTQAVGELPNPFPMPRTLGRRTGAVCPGRTAISRPCRSTTFHPSQINFVVPMNAPTSGNVDIQVVQPSTGRVFAAGQMPMNTAAPGHSANDVYGKKSPGSLDQR